MTKLNKTRARIRAKQVTITMPYSLALRIVNVGDTLGGAFNSREALADLTKYLSAEDGHGDTFAGEKDSILFDIDELVGSLIDEKDMVGVLKYEKEGDFYSVPNNKRTKEDIKRLRAI